MHLRVSLSISVTCLALGAACSSSPTPSSAGFGSGSAGGSAGSSGSSGSSKSGSSGSQTGAATGASGSAQTGTGGSGASGGHTGSASGGSSGTSTAPPPLAGPPAGPYTVSGPKILDKNGHPHLFRGVDMTSLEFSCSGQIPTDAYQFIQPWGANVVRIALNQDCWLSDSANRTYDSTYASTVDEQVTLAQSSGLDVILDLHWSDQGSYAVGAQCQPLGTGSCQQDMADAHSVLFWQQLAAKYANNPGVLFELYNEPHVGGYMPSSANWSTWLNGGSSSGYAVVGMQQLYNAVRVQGGANNLIVVGGLAWAYDLSGVQANAVAGTGIIYNTHPYNTNSTPSAWTQKFGFLTANYPVMATEFGDRSMGQPPACNPSFDQSFIQYANGKASGNTPPNEMSWSAWAFFLADCAYPSLLADSNFTPNAAGMVVQSALLAGP